MARLKRQRQEREEPIPVSNDEINESREEIELNEFLENLGPEGVSEVRLYRVLANGKRVFVTSGPPTQFSELAVQMNHGAGDYIVRGILNGQWFRSKSFAVEAAPGTAPNSVAAPASSELDRLKLELEAQRLRQEQQQAQIEADRREREQRNHEFQLKMFESFGNRGNDTSSIAAMIDGLRGLKDLSGNGSMLSSVKDVMEIIGQVKTLIPESIPESSGDGTNSWQPVITEVVRTVGPAIPSIVAAVSAAAKAPASPASVSVPANPGPTALPPSATMQTNPIPPGLMPSAGEHTVFNQPASATPPNGAAPPAGGVSPAGAAPPIGEAVPLAGAPPAGVPAGAAPPAAVDDYQVYKKQMIQLALPYALSDSNPELYVALGFELMGRGDIGIARLFEELNASKDFNSWFADLQQLEPTINNQRAWFSDFYKAVRTAIATQTEEERGA